MLVQSNYGGDLMVAGVPVGRLLRKSGEGGGDGSVIMVIATDAPVDARNLERMAARSMMGLGRTGARAQWKRRLCDRVLDDGAGWSGACR